MCRTLNIATRGRFSCSPMTRATMGLICCDIKEEVELKFPLRNISNGDNRYKKSIVHNIKEEETYEQMLLREDEEILLIIKMFMRCQ